MLSTSAPATQQHLQGLMARRTTPADPANPVAYFGHVADAVRANGDITKQRAYNLKRRWKVAHQGYESVLNRKKRAEVSTTQSKASASSSLLVARPAGVPLTPGVQTTAPGVAAYLSSLQAAAAAVAAANAKQQATAAKPLPSPKPVAKPVTLLPAGQANQPTQSTPAKPTQPALSIQQQQQQQQQLQQLQQLQKLQQIQQQQAKIKQQQQEQQRIQQQQAQAHVRAITGATTSTAPSTQPATSTTAQPAAAPSYIQQQVPKRADLTVGTTVLIRNTADLVACGARNLAGKMGRIVASPQIYGQELYSVYIDEHEALFQIPFNALTLVGRPQAAESSTSNASAGSSTATSTTVHPSTLQQQSQGSSAMLSAASNAMNSSAPQPGTQGPTIDQVKMEHSFQLHRLMQQQYREIQVLQQQYAECRLVNPGALAGIQQQLSKLRLVHLSQVQTLKSKQALDLLHKQQQQQHHN